MLKYLGIRVSVVFLLFCIYKVSANSCGDCDPQACQPPQGCLAGLAKDSCDCCYVCGRKDGERCDNEDLNFMGFGKCGDDLECRVRNDLDWDDPPEAACFCTNPNPLCGSDGVTYENKCQLTEARYRRRDGLSAVSNEPCVKAPRINNSPQDLRNKTGVSAAMTCEASAWPVPVIQWFVLRNDTLHKLPGNNTRIAVQSRSGPGDDETTSWLYFLIINEEDEGFYICNAENSAGSDSANATVTIIP